MRASSSVSVLTMYQVIYIRMEGLSIHFLGDFFKCVRRLEKAETDSSSSSLSSRNRASDVRAFLAGSIPGYQSICTMSANITTRTFKDWRGRLNRCCAIMRGAFVEVVGLIIGVFDDNLPFNAHL